LLHDHRPLSSGVAAANSGRSTNRTQSHTTNNNNNNNNSIQLFIIYVPSQQPQGQLQTQHSADTGESMITTQCQSKLKASNGERHINADK
jgi:hypothetical protein